jgi:class 3 adenylate cyclase
MGQISTFLIADVRGYTRFTAERGDDAAARLSLKLASLAQEGVSAHEGEVIELRGDEVLAVFASARQALRAAVTLQTSFQEATRADPSLPLPVGIGLDAGEAVSIGDGFRGAALNLAARLCSLAGPGEVLASDGVIHLARRVEGIEYSDRGVAQLKGFDDPVRVMQVTLSESRLAGPSSDDSLVTAPLPIQRLSIGGFLGSLPDGRLVARDKELQRLVDAIDAVAGSRGRVVLLAGEPGVGKTRLAQEVTLQVRNRGFVVACGRCYEAERALPYYPFLEALSTLLTVAPDAVRREAPQRWPYLACLLPDQLGVPLPLSAETQEEHQRLFRSVAAFLQAVAETTPVALLLDDLHWADASSLKLLHHLATATASHPVLLLGTYRDVEVGRTHPLEAALRDLDRERLAERVMLRRLDGQGTRALIAETMGATEISDEFTALVHGRTEGNPFFVQQVLRVLVERGDVYREDGRWERKEIVEIDVPESVRSVIGQRVSRLSEPAQAILQEASVLGQAFTFDDLQALTSLAEEEIEEALTAAARAGLLRETAHDAYGFDHALTRQTLYGELTGRRGRGTPLPV